MGNRITACVQIVVGLALAVQSLQAAQQLARDDPIIRNIWVEGVEQFQASTPSRVLADSIGPRLTGSPTSEAASDWVIDMYESWGTEARQETYGIWDC